LQNTPWRLSQSANPITKEGIIAEIRRVARERNGLVSLRAFRKATGIPDNQFLGKYWTKWNEALVEAGIQTGSFERDKTSDVLALEAIAQLISRLNKWPSQAEMSVARHGDPSFPSRTVFRRLQSTGNLPSKVVQHCENRPDLAAVKEIAIVRASLETEDSATNHRAPIQGYVYMMQCGRRRYKIGHTNSPTRRHRELRIDIPDPTEIVHCIETDDPNGIEAYWHRRFESKRIRETEFFNLDGADVAAFKRRRYQ
jgi:hypothetical protein